MEEYKSWGSWTIFHLLNIILLLVISSQWSHLSLAEEQEDQYEPPSTSTLSEDESKPTWAGPWPNPWTFPGPKPEPKKEHIKKPKPNECNCNCKCDCPKAECKVDNTAGPVVCMPMNCDGNGCKVGSSGASGPLQFPLFGMPGGGSGNSNGVPNSKSAARMNTTATTHL